MVYSELIINVFILKQYTRKFSFRFTHNLKPYYSFVVMSQDNNIHSRFHSFIKGSFLLPVVTILFVPSQELTSRELAQSLFIYTYRKLNLRCTVWFQAVLVCVCYFRFQREAHYLCASEREVIAGP